MIKTYFIFIFFCLLCMSCFDVVEKVKITPTGSGNYTLILNASKSKTRLKSIMNMKTVNGRKVPTSTEITNQVTTITNELKTVSGLSKVVSSIDLEQYIIKLTFDFKSIDNVNTALEKLKTKKIVDSKVPSQLYSYQKEKKIFTKNNQNTFQDEYNKLSAADKEVFSNATYTSILQFDSEIKSQKNTTYQLAPNKKAAKLEGTLLDFINKKKSVYNVLSLD